MSLPRYTQGQITEGAHYWAKVELPHLSRKPVIAVAYVTGSTTQTVLFLRSGSKDKYRVAGIGYAFCKECDLEVYDVWTGIQIALFRTFASLDRQGLLPRRIVSAMVTVIMAGMRSRWNWTVEKITGCISEE